MERLQVPQTRARPERTVLPGRPARAEGDRLSQRRSQRPDEIPPRQFTLASQDPKNSCPSGQVPTPPGDLLLGARGGLSLQRRPVEAERLRAERSPAGMLAPPGPAPDPATPAGGPSWAGAQG